MNKHFNYAKSIFVLLVAALLHPMNAHAATIQTYYLENVQLAGGGTITGHFSFDSTQTPGYDTSYSFTVSGVSTPNYNGTLDATDSIVHPSSGVGPDLLQIINSSGPGTSPGFINLAFTIPLNIFPLVDPLQINAPFVSGSYINNNNASATIFLTSGDVTTTNPNSIPEPTSLALLASGLVGFSAFRKNVGN